ncbi:cytochrome c heme lyase [Flagelloscypha sp. PMI_526]|nr:cytochrome c heme lyase [Flagelloscypha sp. PMI_526]
MGQTTSSPVLPKESSSPAKCPVDHKAMAAAGAKRPSEGQAQCPVDHSALNQMPSLPQTPLSSSQSIDLPTERTVSSIPLRKGWETPEDSVEVMVEIHNFLNEKAWDEVMKWEVRASNGDTSNLQDIQLARFQGKPGQYSPKARFFMLAGSLFPSKFNTEPPFDRHDWIVRRLNGEEVRYVIDYYSAPPEPDGSPVFSLDVRPALDSVGSIKERISFATENAWKKFAAGDSAHTP